MRAAVCCCCCWTQEEEEDYPSYLEYKSLSPSLDAAPALAPADSTELCERLPLLRNDVWFPVALQQLLLISPCVPTERNSLLAAGGSASDPLLTKQNKKNGGPLTDE